MKNYTTTYQKQYPQGGKPSGLDLSYTISNGEEDLV